MRGVLFILVVLAGAGVLVFSHYYVFRKMLRAPGLPRLLRLAGAILLVLLAASIPATFAIGRLLTPRGAVPFFLFAYTWLGLLFYLVLFLALTDLVWWVARVATRRRTGRTGNEAPQDPDRRVFVARLVAGGGLLASTTVTGLGVGSAFGEIRTPEVPVSLGRLPPQLSGFRIAHLTDLHLGPVLRADFVRNVVDVTNRLRPDVVAITGDLVDMPVRALGQQVALLGGLKARYGVFFVTGNHEFFFGAEDWMKFLGEMGIRVLANRRVTVGEPPPGPSFDLAGIHDASAAWFAPHLQPDLGAALDGRDPEREVVLLAHQPKQVDQAAAARVGLQLSGHTHGGQIWPFGALTMMAQPYLAGLHRHGGHTQVFVSRGAGFWGPPMRVLAPSEIPCVVLTN